MNRRSFFAAIAGAPVAVAGVAAPIADAPIHPMANIPDNVRRAMFEAGLKEMFSPLTLELAMLTEKVQRMHRASTSPFLSGEAGPDGLVPLRRKGAGVLGIEARQS